MIKILTACGIKHIDYLKTCLRSTESMDCEHIYEVADESKAAIMNRLLKRVKDTDIVGVLDADDMAVRDWLNAANNLNKYDLIYGDVINNDKNGAVNRVNGKRFNAEQFKTVNLIPYSGVLLRGWLAKSEPYPDISHGNDWLWWHRLLKHSDKFIYVPRICAVRRTWTSHKRCDIPVYRKVKRLYLEHKVKQLIKEI